jgi:hypothetical protein
VNWQVFWVTFGTIFLAEMGDKTQLAALTMTADTRAPWSVFLGASIGSSLSAGLFYGENGRTGLSGENQPGFCVRGTNSDLITTGLTQRHQFLLPILPLINQAPAPFFCSRI